MAKRNIAIVVRNKRGLRRHRHGFDLLHMIKLFFRIRMYDGYYDSHYDCDDKYWFY